MAGRIVQTAHGKGRTNNNDQSVRGKIPVTLDSGLKILCSPEKIKQIGFWD